MSMHIIQSKIIDKLTYTEYARYSQLRPDGVESNLFAYHLKQLVKDRFIIKDTKGYTLAAEGKAYVDRLSKKTLRIRQQPKLVTILDIEDGAGRTLLAKRKHQPYINMLGLPSGKLHLGETLEAAAHRELEEQTHLAKSCSLRHRGVASITIYEGGEMISSIIGHVFSGKTKGEIQPKTTPWIEASTYDLKKLNKLNKHQTIPGTFELKALIDKPRFFFTELTYDLLDY